ncbi:hypothetical protein [Thiothrix nivea]|uniref:Secreted protein n=1 Tax=Thiothrix nivea (strain ATCC 35100 / DSM 5205 / JP2) TaxID=870187 RepID=A0A656HGH6_THINJ|nr:hypothetical protein [Thiothrix nivea]EIJ36008.1 hypothetical protein Thini_3498 [Thiothrix nivea DSM 5205]
MKAIIPHLMGALVYVLALPAGAASAKIDSVYTSLDTQDCTTLQADEAEVGYYKGRCPGAGGYQLDLIEGDLRQTLNVLRPAGKEFPLELWSTVSSGFSSLGSKAEWRVKKEGKKIIPIALIVRYNVSENLEKPDKTTSYLVVSKMTADEICVTDVVKPVKNANQKARDLADVAISKPCLGTGDVRP